MMFLYISKVISSYIIILISKVNCIWYGRWRPNFGCSGHTFWRQWITVVFDEVSIHHCIFTSGYVLDFTNRWFEYLFWVPKDPISLKCGSLFPSLEVPKSFWTVPKIPFLGKSPYFSHLRLIFIRANPVFLQFVFNVVCVKCNI